MPEPRACPALGGWVDRSPLAHLPSPCDGGAFLLEDRYGAARFVLHGEAAALAVPVREGFAVALPAPNRFAVGAAATLYWTGPREWLALCPARDAADVRARLRAHGVCHVAVGHGRTAIGLSGPASIDLLRKGTPLDLHPSVFGSGCCAGTRLASQPVLIACTGSKDEPGFEIHCDRGYAEHLWEWLKTAGREFARD